MPKKRVKKVNKKVSRVKKESEKLFEVKLTKEELLHLSDLMCLEVFGEYDTVSSILATMVSGEREQCEEALWDKIQNVCKDNYLFDGKDIRNYYLKTSVSVEKA